MTNNMSAIKQTTDEKIDDILKIVMDIKDNAVHKDDFNELKNRVTGIENRVTGIENKVTGIEYRLGNVESQLIEVSDKITHVKTGVEKTADILQEKQIITEPEKKIIFNAANPFVMPA
jgi:archaellum component FlaC